MGRVEFEMPVRWGHKEWAVVAESLEWRGEAPPGSEGITWFCQDE